MAMWGVWQKTQIRFSPAALTPKTPLVERLCFVPVILAAEDNEAPGRIVPQNMAATISAAITPKHRTGALLISRLLSGR
jgi:hypothetical protein